MSPVADAPGPTIRARARCRVDLAGGTLDIWPIGLLHPGARTVNVAVELPVTVEIRRLADRFRVVQGGRTVEVATVAALGRHAEAALVGAALEALDVPSVEVRLASASPHGGGLGASSALIVALLAAIEVLLERPRSRPERLVALGRDLEARLMALPTGIQDHYPAILGGALEIAYRPGGEDVSRLPVDLAELGRSLVVAYTGQSHFSAGQNWQVVRRRLDGDPESVELFAGIAEAAAKTASALRDGDLEAAGHELAREWSFRRRLADGVSTPRIEDLFERARAAGAWGGKACGAGGGGSIAVLAPAARRRAVAEALREGGARMLDAPPTPQGLEIEEG